MRKITGARTLEGHYRLKKTKNPYTINSEKSKKEYEITSEEIKQLAKTLPISEINKAIRNT